MFITSNISSFGRAGDYKLKNWKESGLPKPSMVRMKFATIENSLVLKKLGSIHTSDRGFINQKLKHFFDL